MSNRRLCLALAALTVTLAAPRAEAAIVSGTVTFSVANDGPVAPFAGSFDIAFDNSVPTNHDRTAGLSKVMLPFSLSWGVPAFQYFVNFMGTPDLFILGGTESTIFGINPIADDFFLVVSGLSTGDLALTDFAYNTLAGDGPFFDTRPATLSFTPTSSEVPAPAALALFGAGLLGLTALRRRA
jgi:hypothetical protein